MKLPSKMLLLHAARTLRQSIFSIKLPKKLVAKSHLEGANEDFIDAVFYLSMYNSLACWKGDKKEATKELGKLSSDQPNIMHWKKTF